MCQTLEMKMQLIISSITTKRVKYLSLFFFLFVVTAIHAQHTYEPVTGASVSSVKPIKDPEGAVVGLYALNFKDRVSEDSSLYILSFFDPSGDKKFSKDIVLEGGARAAEGQYDGSGNLKLNLQNKKRHIKYFITTDFENDHVVYADDDNDKPKVPLAPNLGYGKDFIQAHWETAGRLGFVDAYELTGAVKVDFHKPNGELLWTKVISKKKSNIKGIAFNDTTKQLLVLIVPSKVSENKLPEVYSLNVANGSTTSTTPLKYKDFWFYPSELKVLKGTTNIKGEYFKSNKKYMGSKSEGYLFAEVTDKGTLKVNRLLSWKKHIKKALPITNNSKAKRRGTLITRRIVSSEDKTFVILESVKKTPSAAVLFPFLGLFSVAKLKITGSYALEINSNGRIMSYDVPITSFVGGIGFYDPLLYTSSKRIGKRMNNPYTSERINFFRTYDARIHDGGLILHFKGGKGFNKIAYLKAGRGYVDTAPFYLNQSAISLGDNNRYLNIRSIGSGIKFNLVKLDFFTKLNTKVSRR
jgi:hypothetical protein